MIRGPAEKKERPHSNYASTSATQLYKCLAAAQISSRAFPWAHENQRQRKWLLHARWLAAEFASSGDWRAFGALMKQVRGMALRSIGTRFRHRLHVLKRVHEHDRICSANGEGRTP
jgi:hypothetical protein